MPDEHAVPETKSEKLHGDKLEGALPTTEGQSGHPEQGRLAPRVMAQNDDDGDGSPGRGSTDGKTMP